MISITIEVINNKEHEAHSRRVCHYAAIIAGEAAKLDASIHPEMIEQAALYHDIGKAEIPNKILDKPGRLTDEEFSLMKKHSEFGASYIEKSEKKSPVISMAIEIARWHHERYDGHGYPDHLVGNQIPMAAQITSIADVYDALTSKRSYKNAFTPERAIEMILNGECGMFNPVLLNCLKACKSQLVCVG